jgi:hypothetical protein
VPFPAGRLRLADTMQDISMPGPGGSVVSFHMDDMNFRVLGPHERGRFAPEAWGHLLALSGSGAINPAELEQIIERALIQFDGRIALDDLRALIEGTGYSDGASAADNQTVH